MYNTLLVALDLSNCSDKVLGRAIGFATGDSQKVHLVHVVDSIPTTYGMESFAIDLNQNSRTKPGGVKAGTDSDGEAA